MTRLSVCVGGIGDLNPCGVVLMGNGIPEPVPAG